MSRKKAAGRQICAPWGGGRGRGGGGWRSRGWCRELPVSHACMGKGGRRCAPTCSANWAHPPRPSSDLRLRVMSVKFFSRTALKPINMAWRSDDAPEAADCRPALLCEDASSAITAWCISCLIW
jgi:hypothetical protein